MSTEPVKGTQQHDTDAAIHAADWFLASEARAARADLESARKRVKAAEQRLAEYRAGGRLTRSEAVLTYSWTLAGAEDLAKQLLRGEDDVTREDLRNAEDAAEAVRRGLAADGYDIPRPCALAQRGQR